MRGVFRSRSYLPPSVGLLLTIWTRFSVRVIAHGRHPLLSFLSTAERQLAADHLDKIFETRLRSRMRGIFRSLISTAERRFTTDRLDKVFRYASMIAHERRFRCRASAYTSNFWNAITLELRASLLAGDLRFFLFFFVCFCIVLYHVKMSTLLLLLDQHKPL